ncbi:hypothetical protein AB0C07_37345 [Actinoplanes missouriensis]|uniref:hypothetical protein n=1 Tax=Actinoplanes missouriensis TaxID=1866 RepID=UPI003405DC29
MSTDLEQRLAATLEAHTGRDRDPAPLIDDARRRGRRIRRRRSVAITLGALSAAAVVAVVALVMPAGPPPDLMLPAAPGEPGAAQRPDLVGADPAAVHFTADELVTDARHVTWSVGRGTESVEFTGRARFVLARTAAQVDGVRQILASAGRPESPSAVRVGDRPGSAWVDQAPGGGPGLWFVKWQPADGLWGRLEIYAGSRAEATAAADRVRFDGARRCAVPFRLTELPAGARVVECSVNRSLDADGGFAEGTLVVADQAGRWLTVRAQRTAGGGRSGAGDVTAGPYAVWRQGSGVLEMAVREEQVELFLTGWGKGYSESEGLAVLSGYQPVDGSSHR